MLNRRAVILLSVVTGVALEIGINALSGRREAWDSNQYWTIGLPAVGLLSGLIGAFSSGRNWRWVALIVPSQVFAMMVRNGEIGNLWPLTLIFSSILSAPFVFAAFIGSRFWRPSKRSESVPE